jgi:hypothetical protein
VAIATARVATRRSLLADARQGRIGADHRAEKRIKRGSGRFDRVRHSVSEGYYAPYLPPRIAGCGLPTWPASFNQRVARLAFVLLGVDV